MALIKRKKYVVWAAAFGGAVFFSAVFARQATAPAPLEPSADERKAARSSLILLKHLHYEHKKFNDALSAQVLDRYLDDLDGSRSYFHASDIASFQAYRLTLDDEIARGELNNVFGIYSRFQKRATERLEFVLHTLNKGIGKLDFASGATLETKRDKAPWARNTAELDELWRKRLMAAVISLRLTGKADEDIQKLLIKRYQNQLNNLRAPSRTTSSRLS